MPLAVGCSKAVVRKNTRTLIREGYPPRAAYKIANDLARKHRHMCKHTAHLKRKPKKKKKRRAPRPFLGIF